MRPVENSEKFIDDSDNLVQIVDLRRYCKRHLLPKLPQGGLALPPIRIVRERRFDSSANDLGFLNLRIQQ